MNSKLIINLPPNQANIALVQCKNPVSALLYAYGSINNGAIDLELASVELEIDMLSIKKGGDFLLAYNICKPKPDESSNHITTTEEIINLRHTDYGFAGVCQVYESSKGKIMRPNEIQSLYDIYVNLNMSADMITLLIGFLNEKGKFSLRNVEKTSYEWHDCGIDTYEAAENYMNNKFVEKNNYRDILKLLGISGRDAVAEEKKYLDLWLKNKISKALITMAYEKTLYNIGELRWPYINKILINWYESGFKTPEDVKNSDGKPKVITSTPVGKSAAAKLLEEYNTLRREREEKATEIISKLSSQSPEFTENQRKIRYISQKIALSAMSGENIENLKHQVSQLYSERDSILNQYNLTLDMINPKPRCEKCKDYGYIGSEMCSCFKERLEKYDK